MLDYQQGLRFEEGEVFFIVDGRSVREIDFKTALQSIAFLYTVAQHSKTPCHYAELFFLLWDEYFEGPSHPASRATNFNTTSNIFTRVQHDNLKYYKINLLKIYLYINLLQFWYQCTYKLFQDGIKKLLVRSAVLKSIEHLLQPNFALSFAN